MAMRKLKKYIPTKFKAKKSVYDKDASDYAVNFIQALCHTTLDTPIPTPDGFTTMGEIQIGDEVFDEKGQIYISSTTVNRSML